MLRLSWVTSVGGFESLPKFVCLHHNYFAIPGLSSVRTHILCQERLPTCPPQPTRHLFRMLSLSPKVSVLMMSLLVT